MQPLHVLLHVLGYRRRRHQQPKVRRRLAAPVAGAARRDVRLGDVIGGGGAGERAEPERGRTLRAETRSWKSKLRVHYRYTCPLSRVRVAPEAQRQMFILCPACARSVSSLCPVCVQSVPQSVPRLCRSLFLSPFRSWYVSARVTTRSQLRYRTAIGTSSLLRRISRAAFIKPASKHDNRRPAAAPLSPPRRRPTDCRKIKSLRAIFLRCWSAQRFEDVTFTGGFGVRQSPQRLPATGIFDLRKPLTGVETWT